MLGVLLVAGLGAVQKSMVQHHTSHVSSSVSSASLSEADKVERLIEFVRDMKGATFIRNGFEHTAQEAADHLQSKWRKHRKKVKSAKGFVEELASRSGLTGIAYRIRFQDGTTLTTNQVLTQELERLEEQP
ncbi:hypothetical protein CLV24_101259 [Pontibacter ummariensis]|uniref:Uncharacterized protein n=2 Tax=Pontibacter ummariensis TaxID=1610492 RepID=A0A239B9S9_9BACT|nr:hypothetical protein CLV24_101259 [Pontibacter ummariensis]SNS04735.1 hypothetical protein SAMN06296052_101259 [Pontibacter ummariensis]